MGSNPTLSARLNEIIDFFVTFSCWHTVWCTNENVPQKCDLFGTNLAFHVALIVLSVSSGKGTVNLLLSRTLAIKFGRGLRELTRSND